MHRNLTVTMTKMMATKHGSVRLGIINCNSYPGMAGLAAGTVTSFMSQVSIVNQLLGHCIND